MMNLPNDIMKFIADFLSPITILLVLRKTCKKLHTILTVKKEFKRIMNDIHVESEKKFAHWNIIQKNQAFIAGSALIHALHLDHHWKPNDIDIWTDNIKKIDIKDNLMSKKPKTSEIYTNNTYGSISVYNINGTNMNINEIYDYEGIYLSDPNMNDRIVNNFDYDFLKASFNGKELIIYEPEYVFNKKSICSCSNLNISASVDRVRKNIMINRHQKRVEKYIKRGFTIIKCTCSSY